MLPAIFLSLLTPQQANERPNLMFEAPAGDQYAAIRYDAPTILPNGRFLTPHGKRMWTSGDLWKVLLSPDQNWIVGIDDSGLQIFDSSHSSRAIKHVALRSNSMTGAFTPDGSKLVVGGGDNGMVYVYETKSWTQVDKIPLNTNGIRGSFATDIAIAKDGKLAYALDVAGQFVDTLDLVKGVLINRTKAGRQPYALALTPDGSRLFVANIGIFDYSVVPKPEPGKGHPFGLTLPPFGYPSKEATNGVIAEGRKIPGLGSPFVPDSQSIWSYSLATPTKPILAKTAKSGILIHAPADSGKSVGGSSPNALYLLGDKLIVSNANNDTVQFFSTDLKLLKTVKLAPVPALAKMRGVIPSAMTVSADKKTLYVCASGINAVAAVDLKTYAVKGYIPTGWFPTAIAITNQDELLIGTQKGLGRGPVGFKEERKPSDERFGLAGMPGFIEVLKAPAEYTALTKEVIRNNGMVPVTRRPHFPKEIKHVVFITKENHTYDGIFGGLKGAKGEPEYAQYGLQGWLDDKTRNNRLPIMPNHIKLAEQFGISDNFYMEPQGSGDGHRWLVGVYPSLWTTRLYYAGWEFIANNENKGRLPAFRSNGSQIPEDYLENGSIWEHLNRGGVTFRNYGEGYELPGSEEPIPVSKSGTLYQVNHPMPKILFDNTCFDFPAFNNDIPDIARADWFKEDIEKMFRKPGRPLPRFLNIAICNDHGAGPAPTRGYPYTSSYMADNDLALGQIVEYLSHTPEWKSMAIFVTQDDSGGDGDHIDRHRSFVLAISPWAKKRYVSTRHTSIMSIIKSIYLIFGLGPNNMFDAVATPLDDMFTDKPDFTPYSHLAVDPRVFKPEATFDPSDPLFKRRRAKPSAAKLDDPNFIRWLRKQNSPPATNDADND